MPKVILTVAILLIQATWAAPIITVEDCKGIGDGNRTLTSEINGNNILLAVDLPDNFSLQNASTTYLQFFLNKFKDNELLLDNKDKGVYSDLDKYGVCTVTLIGGFNQGSDVTIRIPPESDATTENTEMFKCKFVSNNDEFPQLRNRIVLV